MQRVAESPPESVRRGVDLVTGSIRELGVIGELGVFVKTEIDETSLATENVIFNILIILCYRSCVCFSSWYSFKMNKTVLVLTRFYNNDTLNEVTALAVWYLTETKKQKRPQSQESGHISQKGRHQSSAV